MSAPGLDRVRLDELRRRLEEAAYDAPNVALVVTYKPAIASQALGGHVIDQSDPVLQGFLSADGGLAPSVSCSIVSMPPYHPRVNYPSSGQIDWESIVRDSWADDPQSERPRWWGSLIYVGAVQLKRFEMLADDAWQLTQGVAGPTGLPASDWMTHLARRAGILAPTAPRSVIVSAQKVPRSPYDYTQGSVRFADAPPEQRQSVARSPLPSWWTTQLNNVFKISRDAINEILASLPPPEPDKETYRKSEKVGRRPDPVKPKIVAFVRELRDKKKPWKGIPDEVYKQFKRRLTAETLRGYLKSS